MKLRKSSLEPFNDFIIYTVMLIIHQHR